MLDPTLSYAFIWDSDCSNGGRRPRQVGVGERFIVLTESLEQVCLCVGVDVGVGG